MELHRLTRHCYYSDPIQEGDQPVMGPLPVSTASVSQAPAIRPITG